MIYLWDFGDGAAAAGPRSTHTFDRAGSFTVVLTVKDDLGESGFASHTVNVRDVGIPADPTDVAPSLDGRSIPAFGDLVGFLYSGQDPIQTGVAPDAIVAARAAVLRGRALTRQATILFPPGTTAEMVLPGGAHQPLTALSVRATEYTVGEKGPEAMPADLPPTSGYTYCVELSVDEALAAGATEVRFSAPLPFYAENFLGFPVGTDAPLGFSNTVSRWTDSLFH